MNHVVFGVPALVGCAPSGGRDRLKPGLHTSYPESRSKSLCTRTRYFHAKCWPVGLGDSWVVGGATPCENFHKTACPPPGPVLASPRFFGTRQTTNYENERELCNRSRAGGLAAG